MASTLLSLDDLVDACGELWPREGALDGVSDHDLLASLRNIERLSRVLEAARSRRSAEVARRSSVELGHRGLAARRGATSATVLIARETGSSRAGAARTIRVGELLDPRPDALPDSPRDSPRTDEAERSRAFLPLARATADGVLGTEAAELATRILDPILGRVPVDDLAAAIVALVGRAESRSADEIGTLARELRDSLDRVGIEDRDRALRERRSLRRSSVIDGLRRMTLVLDPESDAIVSGALDQILSPRLGGPRFTDASSEATAQRLLDDERTTDQVALDALVDLVQIGSDAGESRLLGLGRPPVRITMTLDDLHRSVSGEPAGAAWLEGSVEPISATTARRHLCTTGALPVVLGGAGLPVDVGQARRLFTGAQRDALAVRDGGCRFWGCDRPPSWCEAHHILEWGAGGPTDLANGILLCRRHHLLVHDHGWRITAVAGPHGFLLHPPPGWTGDPTPRPMPSRTPAWLDTRVA